MKRFLPLLVCAVACQSTPEKLPEEQVTHQTNPEFARIRPVALAVLKTEAPEKGLRERSRTELYKQLIEKRKYSPIRLDVVDARTDSKGVFEYSNDVAVDATIQLKITNWRKLQGQNAYQWAADLVMTHRSGVELFRCELKRGVAKSGVDIDYSGVSNRIVSKMIEKLPERPARPE
ncbi:MAG: hypothetical protein AAGD14_13065 [Planctomycetota bacterium]